MRYFPDPISGWLFLGALTIVLGIACYTDELYTKIPKWLTLPALGFGIFFSVLRGLLMGLNGKSVWLLSNPSPAMGALDGLIFALAGLVTGFLIFFGIWMLGGCGGGDVKLFAAVGAWLGPYLSYLVLLLTVILLAFCLVAIIAWRVLSGRSPKPDTTGRRRVIIRFAPVAALAVMLVALWTYRFDLGFIDTHTNQNTEARNDR
ncbi:MAG: prepilin peptidase [Planctomycetia bacterium]|nr:prepilin peptidase [Planctomycetia bacterium]